MPLNRILLLAAVAAMTSLGIDMCLPGIPLIEMDLDARTGQGVLSSSLFVAGFAVMPLIGGPLSDRIGRSRVMLASLALFILGALGCAFSHTLFSFLSFRLLQGCASGITTTLPLAIVRDLLVGSPARQTMSEIATLSGFMPIVAPSLGNWAIRLGGWKLIFLGQAGFACVLVISTLCFPESLAALPRERLSPRIILRNYRTLISDPKLRICALVFGLLFACTFCFTAISPLIFIQHMGMSRKVFTLIMTLNAVGSILGAAISAFLSKYRVSAHRITMAGLTFTTVSTLFAAVLEWDRLGNNWGLLPLAFLAFLGFNLAGPSLLLDALQDFPLLLGSGAGLMRCIFMVMNFAASGILGMYCVRHLPYAESATTFLMATLSVIGMVLYGRHAHLNAGRLSRELSQESA